MQHKIRDSSLDLGVWGRVGWEVKQIDAIKPATFYQISWKPVIIEKYLGPTPNLLYQNLWSEVQESIFYFFKDFIYYV